MNKWKDICKKTAAVLEYMIGIALSICLLAGGLGCLGYIAALCIGGDTAAEMCTWLYKTYYGVLIKIATCSTLATFLLIYLKGDANWVNPIKYWKERIAAKKAERE